jgi:peroxiredoxin Q/BCP
VARILPNPAWITEPLRESRAPHRTGYDDADEEEKHMAKLMLSGMAALLLLASAGLWMLRPGTQRPEEGSAAPDFALQDQNGRIHRPGDYAGRWLVLYFYPRDDTPGCIKEACRFRDDIGTLGELDAAVVGVSADSARSHADFSRKYRLPFPLLSDPDGQTAAAYGSLLNLGVMRFARRHTFIIAPDGRIAARFNRVDPAHHATEVGRVLRSLQHARIAQPFRRVVVNTHQ